MKGTLLDFIRRYSILFIFLILFVAGANLEKPELRALLLASLLECMAIGFSSFAAFVFTRVRFTDNPEAPNLGLIFLGVHICLGFSILALYLAQFAS